ncbi:putative MFS transporter [Aspergillus stella-maris]|uniref:putative MFS transporter n=1 Tax=Aspergillus stella-maris TaxID=1810926 RepID=UPI003CCCABDF
MEAVKEVNSLHLEHVAKDVEVGTKDEQQVQVTATEEAFIRKKFDRRVLPIVCILYVFSYLDRGNIGNAKTAGIDSDLGLSDSQWAWVLNAFYICYVLFEWTTVFWKLFPAHIYVTGLCICWGTAVMCAGAVDNLAELIVCRALLGVFEAAFGAGAPYFLSLFYQRRELGFRVSILLGMSPVANCFASALAYGITHIKHSALASWRFLFIIDELAAYFLGAPTVLFGIFVFFFLADSPGTAKFLSESEQTAAAERLHTIDRTAKNRLDRHQVLAGLTDYKNYVHTFIHFCCNFSFAGLSNFLPTIIEHMGYTSINAQGLSAPPYFVSFLCCVAAAIFSDRYGKRGLVIVFFSTIGMVGYLILAAVQDENQVGPRYLGGGDSKKGAGMALLAVFGQCSSFVSSTVFPDSEGPTYIRGCAIGCALTGCIAVMAGGLYLKLSYENKKRDRMYGPVTDDVRIDVTEDGDANPRFRYLV